MDCEDIPYIVDVIKPYLLGHVKSSDLLPYMSFIVKDKANRIRKLDSEGNNTEATELLLKCLEEAKEEPGRYAAFRDALGQAGYEHVVSVLQGGQVDENHFEHCELLKIFADPIIEKIDPDPIIRHLRPHELLTLRDESEIRNCQNQHSREDAVFMLLNLVHRRKTEWYRHLMSTMYELYPQIVELVDPHLKEKMDLQKPGFSQCEDMDTNNIMEHTVSVTGPAYQSETLMAVPHAKVEKRDHISGTENEGIPNKRQKTESESRGTINVRSSECLPQFGADRNEQTVSVSSSNQKENAEQNAIQSELLPFETTSGTCRRKYDLSKDQEEELYLRIKKEFIETVDPTSLMTCLRLPLNDEERVAETKESKGRIEANAYLLRTLTQRVSNWVDSLCHGLREPLVQMGFLADNIEETRQDIIHAGLTTKSKVETDPTPAKPIIHTVQEASFARVAACTSSGFQDVQKSVDSSKLVSKVLEKQIENDPSDQKDENLLKNLDQNNTQKPVMVLNEVLPIQESGDTSNEVGLMPPSSVEDSQTSMVQPLTLRPYQEELARPALDGANTIICAPTASGKTLVAAEIMKAHLKRGVRKIIFFAETVVLVQQQYKQMKHFMPKTCRILQLSGENQDKLKVPKKDLFMKYDILIMTPQILVEALQNDELSSLSQFTLLVFDECHHTIGNHPFNEVMFHYMKIKLGPSEEGSKETLPQILGLTATLGVGKAKSVDGAVDHIRRLCAHLDASGGVTTVREHIENLADYIKKTLVDVMITDHRKEDIFNRVVSDTLMKTIETMMLDPENVKGTDQSFESEYLHPPAERDGELYVNWVSKMRRKVTTLENSTAKRFYSACRRMLEYYNKALILNEDCRTKDALQHLEDELETLYSTIRMDKTDKTLKEEFEKVLPVLKDASQNPLCVNPKLTCLSDEIMETFEKEHDSRCMVFVKTRKLANALKQWMEEDPNLMHLKPGIFTGQSPSTKKGGMTRSQQLNMAELFRKGNHKIIVATSVVEEGMDFKQCNLVIRYEYTTNVESLIQARGRARAADSKFVVMTSNKHGTADKDVINLIREGMMNEALVKLETEIRNNPQKYQADILQIQKEEKTVRDQRFVKDGERVHNEDELDMLCSHCDVLACFSTDFRTIKESNHVVISNEFKKKIDIKPHPKTGYQIGPDMKKKSKIFCKECRLDWGITVIYQDKVFPVIKKGSLVAVDGFGIKHEFSQKWDDAPFKVQEITDEERFLYQSFELL